MAKIFVSQSTLKLGRNRPQRTLERKLDKEPFLAREQVESSICEYFENCNVAKISGRNCADYKTCQTYKFKTKYKGKILSLSE